MKIYSTTHLMILIIHPKYIQYIWSKLKADFLEYENYIYFGTDGVSCIFCSRPRGVGPCSFIYYHHT